MTPAGNTWTQRVRRWLPSRELLVAHPWLKPVAGRLLDPQLWRMQHESVARGVAVGIFWAFVIPVAQTLAAAVHCAWWRANLPVAATMTLLTNPLTFGFWLWLAHKLGLLVLGEPAYAAPVEGAGALAWLSELGWPTVLGMGLFAVGGATLGYLAVKLIWHWRVWLRRRTRRQTA